MLHCISLFKKLSPREKKLKTYQERPQLLSDHFIKCFSRQPLSSGPKNDVLYRFDCRTNEIVEMVQKTNYHDSIASQKTDEIVKVVHKTNIYIS